MEDVLSTLEEKEITELLYLSLIEKNPKLKNLKDRLSLNKPSSLDEKLKTKLKSCEDEAQKKFNSFKESIQNQLSKTKLSVYIWMEFLILYTVDISMLLDKPNI